MDEVNDWFYDQEKWEFQIGFDIKLAHILGDDIDNPKYTFRLIGTLLIKELNYFQKNFMKLRKYFPKSEFDNMEKYMDNIFDNNEQELYFRIKTLFDDFEKQNNNLNSQNLLLQKYLAKLDIDKIYLLVK